MKFSNVYKTTGLLSLAVFLGILAGSANAAFINGQNWADDVDSWSGSVQNYGGTLMDASTTWWLIGPSDSDVDKNGYAWDEVDSDYVAGWRGGGSASITLSFDAALEDIFGNDLVIRMYSGGSASASVWASSDNITFHNIGGIDGGTPSYFRDEVFEFGGAVDNVYYIRIDRGTSGTGTGMFFDSFASVPEPTTMTLLLFGGLGLLGSRNRRK